MDQPTGTFAIDCPCGGVRDCPECNGTGFVTVRPEVKAPESEIQED